MDDVTRLAEHPGFDTADQPYPGLRSFRRDESHIFFGREETIYAMVDRLKAHRFLAVTGASGSGKSSLVRTGLLDALDRGLLSGAGPDWIVVDFRPGSQPLAALAAALVSALEADEAMQPVIRARLAEGPAALPGLLDDLQVPARANILLLVDQFEEAFRFRQSDEADAFVALVLASVAQPRRSIYGVLTMRSDFLGECSRFRGLAEAINESQFLAPRLTRAQLREAIEGPAAVYGGVVEPALVTRLLNDVGSNPDQLPLMQHVLMLIWQEAWEGDAEGRIVLTAKRYEELGGIAGDTPDRGGKGALSTHLDLLLSQLDPGQKRLAEAMFRTLVDSEGAPGRDIRSPTELGEIAAVAGVAPEALVPVIEEFRAPGRHFLTPAPPAPLNADTVIDISHESLIRQWGTLRNWVMEEALSAAQYRRIEGTAELWDRSRDSLLRNPALGDATAWRARQHPNAAWAARYGGQFALAMRFLDISIRRSRLRKAGLWAALLLLLGGLSFEGYRFWDAAKQAEAALEAATVEHRLQRSLDRISQQTANFGTEANDFHVPPQDALQRNIGTQTPTSIPGGTMLLLRDLPALFKQRPRPILVDAWNGSGTGHNTTIPTAVRIPFASGYGTFDDEAQSRLVARLDNVTEGDRSRPLVFFCVSSSCWESYNTALRAIHAKFQVVYWLRGGNDAWVKADGEWQNVNEEIANIEARHAMPSTPLRQRWADAATLGDLARLFGTSDGDKAAARQSTDHSPQYLQDLSAQLGRDPAFLFDLIQSHERRGDFYKNAKWTGSAETAIESYREAIKLRKDSLDLLPGDYMARMHYAEALLSLARYESELGQDEAAKAARDQAKDVALPADSPLMAARRAGAAPGSWYRDLAEVLRNDGLGTDYYESLQQARRLDKDLLSKQDAPGRDAAAVDLWAAYRAEGELYESAAKIGQANYDEFLQAALVNYNGAAHDLESVINGDAGWPGGNLAAAEAHRAAAAIYARTDDLEHVHREAVAALFRATEASKAGNPDAPATVTAIAAKSASYAWTLDLNNASELALDLCDRALAAAPELQLIEMNRAHALMLLNRTEEARNIYLRFAGQTVNGAAWNATLLDDFAQLRRRGHNSPLMREVEAKLLAPTP